MTAVWSQEGARLFVERDEGKFYFDMPGYFRLGDVHPDLTRLAEVLLFLPWEPGLADWKFTRKGGGNVGLAYSGGVDSTACYAILPREKTVCLYHQRDGIPLKRQTHDGFYTAVAKNGISAIVVKTDCERVRLAHGLSAGFATDFDQQHPGGTGIMSAIGLVLLADYLDLGYLCVGQSAAPLYYTGDGRRFRDWGASDDWIFWRDLFAGAGLAWFCPSFCVTEVGTDAIVRQAGLFAQACVRGHDGAGCGACKKCWRKAGHRGELLPLNIEVTNEITRQAGPMFASLIAGPVLHGLTVPGLERYAGVDLSWMGGYYRPALELIPAEWREHTERELARYLKPMPDGAFESFDLGAA
jgi:hypothetical protein